MAAISAGKRQAVKSRARACCEYCLNREDHASASFAIDHISPRSRGGNDELENLAFACAGCNGRKYNKVEAIDPALGLTTPLFNPRMDNWSEHFQWDATFTSLIGVSPIGRATVSELDLNRDALINIRTVLRASGKHPPAGAAHS